MFLIVTFLVAVSYSTLMSTILRSVLLVVSKFSGVEESKHGVELRLSCFPSVECSHATECTVPLVIEQPVTEVEHSLDREAQTRCFT